MAYSVNWLTKVVSIPSADLALVSGTRYQLHMSDFLSEIRRLEAAFDGGLWAEQILDHTNAKTLAGTTFAPFDEIINGYTIQFTGVATRVDLIGSNNNIIDTLIANGVSVVPSNSAGLQVVTSGSGVTAGDKADIINGVWGHATAVQTVADIEFIKAIEGGKWDIVSNQMIFYAEDNITEVARFNLFKADNTPTMDNPMKRVRV